MLCRYIYSCIGKECGKLKAPCLPGRNRSPGSSGRSLSMRLSLLPDEWYFPSGPCGAFLFELATGAFPGIEPFHFATGSSSVQWTPFFNAGPPDVGFGGHSVGNTGHTAVEDLLWPRNGLSYDLSLVMSSQGFPKSNIHHRDPATGPFWIS